MTGRFLLIFFSICMPSIWVCFIFVENLCISFCLAVFWKTWSFFIAELLFFLYYLKFQNYYTRITPSISIVISSLLPWNMKMCITSLGFLCKILPKSFLFLPSLFFFWDSRCVVEELRKGELRWRTSPLFIVAIKWSVTRFSDLKAFFVFSDLIKKLIAYVLVACTCHALFELKNYQIQSLFFSDLFVCHCCSDLKMIVLCSDVVNISLVYIKS